MVRHQVTSKDFSFSEGVQVSFFEIKPSLIKLDGLVGLQNRSAGGTVAMIFSCSYPLLVTLSHSRAAVTEATT